MKTIKILVADDHKIFRQGIKALLEHERDMQVIAEAGNRDELLDQLNKREVGIILMDVDMGGVSGIDLAMEVRKIRPSLKILALSMHSDKNYILSMLESGATGYVLKTTGKEEIVAAIKAVAAGDTYFSSEVSARLLEHIQKGHDVTSAGKSKQDIPLTPREIEVLKLIAREYSNPEIAEELVISIRTVDTHRRNLLEKLNVKNTAGLVKYALRMGLINQ